MLHIYTRVHFSHLIIYKLCAQITTDIVKF